MRASVFASVGRRDGLAAQEVLAPAYLLEMGWIDAGTIPTEVVELAALRDRAHENLVDDEVCAANGAAHAQLAVAVAKARDPSPAAVLADLDLAGNAFW